jgi:rubrerythrin
MSRVDENAELGRVIAEGAESGLMSDKLAELLYIQDIGKSLAVIADSMRPTGHWIVSYPDGARVFKCNQCNKYADIHHATDYCPNCGSEMAESEE